MKPTLKTILSLAVMRLWRILYGWDECLFLWDVFPVISTFQSLHPVLVLMLLPCAPVVTSTWPVMLFTCLPKRTVSLTKEQPFSFFTFVSSMSSTVPDTIKMCWILNKQTGAKEFIREVEGDYVKSKAMKNLVTSCGIILSNVFTKYFIWGQL